MLGFNSFEIPKLWFFDPEIEKQRSYIEILKPSPTAEVSNFQNLMSGNLNCIVEEEHMTPQRPSLRQSERNKPWANEGSFQATPGKKKIVPSSITQE